MELLTFLGEQIFIFYNFWKQNLEKFLPKVDLLLIPFKKVFLKIQPNANIQKYKNKLKISFFLFSKKKITFLTDKAIKKEKISNIDCSENFSTQILTKKKNVFYILEKILSQKHYLTRIGIPKKNKKIFFLNNNSFYNKNNLKKIIFLDFSYCLRFIRSIFNQRLFFSTIRFRYQNSLVLKSDVILNIPEIFTKKLCLDQKKLRYKMKKKSQKKSLNIDIMFDGKKKHRPNKNILNIGIYSNWNNLIFSIFFQLTFLINPSSKHMFFYQLVVCFFFLLNKNLEFQKSFFFSFNEFINLSYIFSEKISFHLYYFTKYGGTKSFFLNKKIDPGKFFIFIGNLYGFLGNKDGFFDILGSKIFFLTNKKILFRTENYSMKNIKKITFFSIKNFRQDLNFKKKKIKLREIIYLFFLVRKKEPKTRYTKKRLNIQFFIRKIKFGKLSDTNSFFFHKNIFFFLKKKKIQIFRKNFPSLFSFWKIKKLKFTKKNLIFYFKIQLFPFKSKLERFLKNKFAFNMLKCLFCRKIDFDKIINKLTFFKAKIIRKNFKKEKVLLFNKFNFIKKNIIHIKNIFFMLDNCKKKKNKGHIQFHLNGISLIQKGKKKSINIFFEDIKFIFLDNIQNQLSVRFYLHGQKISNETMEIVLEEILIYFEKDINYSKSIFKDENMSDDSDLSKEEIENSINHKIKEILIFFTNSFCYFCGKNIEIPQKKFGFYGFYKKAIFSFYPTKNLLQTSSFFFPLMVTFSNIEFVIFERIITGVKNFDTTIILNCSNSNSQKTSFKLFRFFFLDFRKFDSIQSLFVKNILTVFKGPNYIDWNNLSREIEKNKKIIPKEKIGKFLEKMEKTFQKKNLLANIGF